MFEEIRAFFALPADEKNKILADQNNRGYTPYQEETLSPATQKVGDTKEGLYFGREIHPDDAEAHKPLHGPNQWPDPEVAPRFRSVTERYFTACTKLGYKLLRTLALSLDLPPDYFKKKFDAPMLFLRPLHHTPDLSDTAAGIYGAGAHTDYGMLTILATDSTPGLQILQSRTWVDVQPLPGSFIFNLGDLLERWTNGRYKSTMHRVLSKSGKDRYSIPFFFEPNFDAEVQCLPTCCKDEAPRYPKTTAGQHLLNKYNETHALFEDTS
eukprot:TRINITY_DN23338_c0_g2_i1.p1 TRINITY_DN23338_c0_g2~~TRINITY_DN23338_c0_g2_i1.p1  ORF type:complete len:268 (-),score=9.01 TRINITY_DN23338_c0_g2_i1:300-1103(-)